MMMLDSFGRTSPLLSAARARDVVRRGAQMSATEYRRLQRALRPVLNGAPTLMTYFVDANRGLDTNTGTSKAAPLQTLAAAAAKGLAPGNVVALANDSIFALATRISWGASGAAGNPIWLTNYDPTGDYPTDRPTVTWSYKPSAAQWTWDATRAAWYFTNPNAREFRRQAYVRIAGRWGICFGSTYASLTNDFRFAVDDANRRLYLYAPPGIDPTTYYGGPNSVVLGEAQGGALAWLDRSYWTVENIRGAEMGYLLHPLAAAANVVGLQFRGCSTDLASGLIYGTGADAYYTSVHVVDCAATRSASAAIRPERSTYQWIIEHNRVVDGNNCESAGGGVYINEFSATATALRGGSVVRYNYIEDIKSAVGDHPIDGAGLYAEQRSSALWLANIVRRCAVGMQDNSGARNVVTSNFFDDVNTVLFGTDASGIGSQHLTFDSNTALLSVDRSGVSSDHVYTALAPIFCMNGGAGKTIRARGNVIIPNGGVGVSESAIRYTAGTTVDFGGNTLPAGVPAVLTSVGGTVPDPVSTLNVSSYLDDIGTLQDVTTAATSDLLGEAITRSGRRGCLA